MEWFLEISCNVIDYQFIMLSKVWFFWLHCEF